MPHAMTYSVDESESNNPKKYNNFDVQQNTKQWTRRSETKQHLLWLPLNWIKSEFH